MSEANKELVRRHLEELFNRKALARGTRMRPRPTWLAWGFWMLTILGLVVVVWLDQLLRQTDRPELVVLTPKAFPPVLGALSAATVGALVASRRPRHPVGWLLLGFGLSLSAAGVVVGYANYGVAHAGVPGAGLVARYLPATIVMAIACDGFILLVTPTGALPTPRWRWWAASAAPAASSVSNFAGWRWPPSRSRCLASPT